MSVSVIGIGHRYRSSVIGHRSSVSVSIIGHRYRSSVIGIGHRYRYRSRYRSSLIGHRSSVIRLNPQVSLGCASFGLRQTERHRYRSSKSMAETMDAASIESGAIRIEWAKRGGGLQEEVVPHRAIKFQTENHTFSKKFCPP
jgi:hypothetical protein